MTPRSSIVLLAARASMFSHTEKAGRASAARRLVLVLAAVGACGGNEPVEKPALSSMRLSLAGTAAEDVRLVRFEVSGGARMQSKTVEVRSLPLDPDRPLPVADAFFTLPSGTYRVEAFPLTAASKPSSRCAPAKTTALVRPEMTTEILLAIDCSAGASGGLDVVGTFENAPVITELDLRPVKWIASCETLALRAQAHDADGDVLTFSWKVLDAPSKAGFRLQSAGATARFAAETPGDYELKIVVNDRRGGAAALRFPVHVVGPPQSCLQTDDDGDGVSNVVDNCSTVPNADQADDDADAAGNLCDTTPPLHTATVAGESITYAVINGRAVFQSDIILGEVDAFENAVKSRGGTVSVTAVATSSSSSDLGVSRQALVAVAVPGCPLAAVIRLFDGFDARWPDGVVPFEVGEGYSDAEAAGIGALMSRVQAHYDSRTSVRFVRHAGQRDFLVIRNFRAGENPGGLSCGMSRIGRLGGRQEVSVAPDADFGCVVHELLHALGAAHEQSRDDRDGFVTIQSANIVGGMEHNFNREGGCAFDDLGAYDLQSVMHYSAFAFQRDGLTCSEADRSGCTIVPRDSRVPLSALGQRDGLSLGDRRGVCRLYGDPGSFGVLSAGRELREGEVAVLPDGGVPRLQLDYAWRGARDTIELTITSDRDGVVMSGTISFDGVGPAEVPLPHLSAGRHTLTFEVDQHCPLVLVRQVDVRPHLRIVSPVSGAHHSHGLPVPLTAEAIGLGAHGHIEWSSSRDGVLGMTGEMGSLLSVHLTVGVHTILAVAAFPDGTERSDSVDITVTNSAPTIRIVSPTEGARLCADVPVRLVAASGDADQDAVSVSWSFGGAALGTGGALDHTFTGPVTGLLEAIATDSTGVSTATSLPISVSACMSHPPTIIVMWPDGDGFPNPGSEDRVFDFHGNDGVHFFRDLTVSVAVIAGDGTAIPDDQIVWRTDRTDMQPGELARGRRVTIRLLGNDCGSAYHNVTVAVTNADHTIDLGAVVWRVLLQTLC